MIITDINHSLDKTLDIMKICAAEKAPLKRLFAGEAALKEIQKTIDLINEAIESGDYQCNLDGLVNARNGVIQERNRIESIVKLDRELVAMMISCETI